MKRFLLPLLGLLIAGTVAAPRSPRNKNLKVFMFPDDAAVAGAGIGTSSPRSPRSPRAMHASPRGGKITSRRSSRGGHTPVAARSKSPLKHHRISHVSTSAVAHAGAGSGDGSFANLVVTPRSLKPAKHAHEEVVLSEATLRRAPSLSSMRGGRHSRLAHVGRGVVRGGRSVHEASPYALPARTPSPKRDGATIVMLRRRKTSLVRADLQRVATKGVPSPWGTEDTSKDRSFLGLMRE
jgi:hypothetical protein